MSSDVDSHIHVHSLQGPDSDSAPHDSILQNALATLRPHLPVSLPLYRRLQFGRFFDATTLLTNLALKGSSFDPDKPSEKPWLIAFVDRSCRPETEVWLYCSWESQHPGVNAGDGRQFDNAGKEESLLRSLLASTKSQRIPESIHADIIAAKEGQRNHETNGASSVDSVGLSRDDYAAHMLDPQIMLWGSIHQTTTSLLQQIGVAGGMKSQAGATPNLMLTWDVDALSPEKPLPSGLRWGDLRREHFELVRSRTQIPRQDRTLAVLPNLGIFPSDANEPVAWVFVGLDGSLTTLHVEAEWRGRGLAKAMTVKLFRERMGLFWEEGLTKWAHGYVIRGNKESEGMCRSLKGRSDWDVYWVRVDLAAVP